MELEFVIQNKIKRERLPKPVYKMADEEINNIIYKENWTTLAALSRLAFWDIQRSLFIKKETRKDATSCHLINGAILDMINNSLFIYH
jgi:hypothetical protein